MILLQTQFNTSDLFTPGSLGTLAGATLIVYIICGAIQQAFDYNPKWLALLVSIIVSLIAAYIGVVNSGQETSVAGAVVKHQSSAGVTYLIAFFNGFLIYATATGGNQISSNLRQNVPPVPPVGHPAPPIIKPRRFNSNWWG